MQVKVVMTRNIAQVPADIPLTEAVTQMQGRGLGQLPVTDGERVVGMLIGRDAAERAAATGHDPATTTVRDVMTPEVVYVYEDQDVSEAARLMRERKYLQLLVLSRDHRLVGLVSLEDVAGDSGDHGGPDEVLAHVPEPMHPATPVYKRILVPLDGSDLAEHILPHVMALARALGAMVALVRVSTPPIVPGGLEPSTVGSAGPPADPTMLLEAERWEGQRYLTELAERLRSRGLSVTYEQPEGRPADAIIAAARRWDADLIAMTTHGRGGGGQLVFGGVAHEVLRHAPCPLLLVRVKAHRTTEPTTPVQEQE